MTYRMLAFDRAPPSDRRIDADGHMHVANVNLSKSNVCPYGGDEIPDAEALGLDPNKTYMLYRDAAELEKAAPTLNRKPLLLDHKAVMADDHDREVVCGAIGSDVRWEAPYLVGSLAIWDAEGIEGVENDTKRELSPSYRYRAVMEPGEIDGIAFDGRMVDIEFNHVALVIEGRTGPDVFVNDRKPPMLKSRKALLVSGAIATYLGPKLALDAKVDLSPALAKVTAKTWATDKAPLAAAIRAATKGKLAADADVGDVVEFLDALNGVTDGEVDADMVETAAEQTGEMEDKPADDEDGEMDKGKLMDFLKGKLTDEQLAEVSEMMGVAKPDADDEADKDPKMQPPTKAAMDAAVAKARKDAANDAADFRLAERETRPFIGELTNPPATAVAIYKLALDAAKVDYKGVPDTVPVMRALLRAAPEPGATTAVAKPLAQDAAGHDAFSKRFPEARPLLLA